MPFSEAIKKQTKEKSAFRCCMCEQFNASIQVHHIIPEEENGPDTFENAAPLCGSCHDSYGGNPDKRKLIKEKRNWWYSIVSKKYGNIAFDPSILENITIRIEGIEKKQQNNHQDISELKKDISELKTCLNYYNDGFFSSFSNSSQYENIKNLNKDMINKMIPSSSNYISNIIINSTTALIIKKDFHKKEDW